MRQSVSTVRVLSYALLAVAVAAGTTGCFKRGVKGDYGNASAGSAAGPEPADHHR